MNTQVMGPDQVEELRNVLDKIRWHLDDSAYASPEQVERHARNKDDVVKLLAQGLQIVVGPARE
jgi:hypothetical protein